MELTLCLTHDCNMRCAYCYAGRKRPVAMSWDVARCAVDLAFRQSVAGASGDRHKPVAQIGYFGGEPLLEWELLVRSAEYAIAEARRMGIELLKTVTTNMVLLDEKKARWLKDHGFHVGLSLDGNAAMHNTLRRMADGSDSHAACSAALKYFRGPDASAEVIVVVDPRNIGRLVESVNWLMEQDIRRISINPNFSASWPPETQALWQSAYEDIGALYVDCFRKGRPVRINTMDGKIRTHIGEGYADCDKCGFGRNEISVAPSGNIYPCERVVGDDNDASLRIGNVRSGFDEINRQKLVACRGNSNSDCADCELGNRCMNWCSCINLATTGRIDRVAGIVCMHEKIAISAADKVAALLFAESNPAFLERFYQSK